MPTATSSDFLRLPSVAKKIIVGSAQGPCANHPLAGLPLFELLLYIRRHPTRFLQTHCKEVHDLMRGYCRATNVLCIASKPTHFMHLTSLAPRIHLQRPGGRTLRSTRKCWCGDNVWWMAMRDQLCETQQTTTTNFQRSGPVRMVDSTVTRTFQTVLPCPQTGKSQGKRCLHRLSSMPSLVSGSNCADLSTSSSVN